MRIFYPCVAVMLAASCGSAVDVVGASSGGSGGGGGMLDEQVTSSATSSGTSSSSSGGVDDGGADGSEPDSSPDGGSCATCSEVLKPPHPTIPICDDVAFGLLAAYVSCGCVSPGSCSVACAGSTWCAGMYPIVMSWTDPTGECLACLSTPGPGGCADQAATCLKN